MDISQVTKILVLICLTVMTSIPLYAQSQIRIDIPPWFELEALDSPDAAIKRYALTARGSAGMEFPIVGSQGLFCVLNQEHNLLLNYYPERDEWVFQVQLNPSAQFAAGGIATCLQRTTGR